MKTTLNKIRAHSPCETGWKKLLLTLGKTKSDNDPLSLRTILDSNGLDDALWCLLAVDGQDRIIRLYAVWCANQVRHLMTDSRSVNALVVAEKYANGLANEEELAAARDAARAAAWDGDAAWGAARAAAWGAARAAAWDGDAARDAAWDAARDAALAAADGDAARAAARAAARDAARAAAWDGDAARDAALAAAWDGAAARDAARAAARDAARDAAWDAARAAAWGAARAAARDGDAARDAQEKELRRVIDCCEYGGDPYKISIVCTDMAIQRQLENEA